MLLYQNLVLKVVMTRQLTDPSHHRVNQHPSDWIKVCCQYFILVFLKGKLLSLLHPFFGGSIEAC